MNRQRAWVILLILAVLASLAAMYWRGGVTERSDGSDRLSVYTTIPPYKQFIERVGGERVTVSVMVPPGASPHTHEPTPSQLIGLNQADAYIMVGSPIEFELTWIDQLAAVNPSMPFIDSSAGLDLMELEGEHGHEHDGDAAVHEESGAEEGGLDPHVWTSPRNVLTIGRNIRDGLATLDPGSAAVYGSNFDSFAADLEELSGLLRQSFSGVTSRKFLVFHPSWGYLARDFGLEQVPIEEEGKEPTAQGIGRLIDQARIEGIRIIFAQPELNTESARVVAQEIDGEVVLLSPLDEDYLANMRRVSEILGAALK
ncbi:hypothetical protein AMJ57_05125 [Parcubacteria bacterium SG8_24]|nr:MAG: hypothetical protein AMJ57_05125 [Parcubacteria bacterium SG8_24]